MIEELDLRWISDYEEDYKKYNYFYEEEIEKITVFFFYVDIDSNISKIKQEKLDIKDKKISKEQLIYIINNNKYSNNNKFKLDYILRYNITLKSKNIEKFVKIDNDKIDNNYLQVLHTCSDIYFDNTINILQDLNSIFLIYSRHNPQQTKKIYITNKSKKKTRKIT